MYAGGLPNDWLRHPCHRLCDHFRRRLLGLQEPAAAGLEELRRRRPVGIRSRLLVLLIVCFML